MSGYNDDVLAAMKPSIAAGKVSVSRKGAEQDRLLLSRFPFSVGRIQWERVPRCLHVQIEDSETPEPDWAKARAFLDGTAGERGISMDDRVYYSGDNMEDTLEMSFRSFVESCEILLEFPQHHYVWPKGAEWCFSYTFEGTLYFGYAKVGNGR